MRTTLEIDERLLKQALALTKAKTKKELIHRSLEALIRQERIGLSCAARSETVWKEVGNSLRRAGVRTTRDVDQLVAEVRARRKGTAKRTKAR